MTHWRGGVVAWWRDGGFDVVTFEMTCDVTSCLD
jgi:hypothetical protein